MLWYMIIKANSEDKETNISFLTLVTTVKRQKKKQIQWTDETITLYSFGEICVYMSMCKHLLGIFCS